MTRVQVIGLGWFLLADAILSAAVQPVADQGFLQEVAQHDSSQRGLPATAVTRLVRLDSGEVAAHTSEGWYVYRGERWVASNDDYSERIEGPGGWEFAQSTRHPSGLRVAVAGANGLWEQEGKGDWTRLLPSDGKGRSWAVGDVRAVTYDARGRLWFGILAGLGCLELDGVWRFYEGKDGLPYNRFTCAIGDASGGVWFGTEKGLVGFREGRWRYRQGRRWLVDDAVRSLLAMPDGTLWIGTDKGVSRIHFQEITLGAKAQVYEKEVAQLIKRTPYGYTSPVRLAAPGDRDGPVARSDNDNDGLWTSMYGAGQCFAYAATGEPEAKARAVAAFEALRFLQVVTQGGEPPAPKGYVARSIRASSLPNPNMGRVEHDRQRQANDDRLWKVYEPRWPLSADGQWYWKSDTSSDELDGHYFFYPLYHDLVADTAAEKARVQQVVRELTDHLIAHDFNLTDHDGRPTRWGIFGPDSLNGDVNWSVERGLNSLSMLAYLTVAEHVTGEARYGFHLRELQDKHAYDTNAMVPKIQRGVGSGNQSDDEMAFMGFYNVLRYSKDEALKRRLRRAFHQYWTLEQPELNPFFNFTYAACALGTTDSDPWGEHELSPWDGWLEQSLSSLRAFPLDRANWAHENSHRLDLVRLPRQQSIDAFDEGDRSRGYRVNGLALPVDERYFNHWNTDPFRLDYGGDGRGLGCGTVFLLPYYMGLYHGFIEPPQ